jgi:hypothetical protein
VQIYSQSLIAVFNLHGAQPSSEAGLTSSRTLGGWRVLLAGGGSMHVSQSKKFDFGT